MVDLVAVVAVLQVESQAVGQDDRVEIWRVTVSNVLTGQDLITKGTARQVVGSLKAFIGRAKLIAERLRSLVPNEDFYERRRPRA